MFQWIDQLHEKLFFRLFAIGTRIILAIGFIPSGMKKVLGMRFTQLTVDTPIGFFFEAMYQTGFYWNFLGGAQVLAALLLLIPRTKLLGALLYFPLIVNIFLITVSLHFRGTWVITGLMLLASIYLLVLEHKSLRPLFLKSQSVA